MHMESWLTTEYAMLDIRANSKDWNWETIQFQLLGYAYAKPRANSRQLFIFANFSEDRFQCSFDQISPASGFVRRDDWFSFNGYVLTKELPSTTSYLRIAHKKTKKEVFWSREAWAKRPADINQDWADRGYAFSLLKEPK